MFSEVAPSDSTEQASQSVPMVSTSTPGLPVPGAANTGEEGDDSLLEPDADRFGSLCCLSYSRVHLVFVQLQFLLSTDVLISGPLLRYQWTQWSLKGLSRSQASNLTKLTCPPPARSLPLALPVTLFN